MKVWRNNHPDYFRIIRNKRRRELKFIPLNEYVVGLEGHHINNVDVIYMPHNWHRNFGGFHTLKKPTTMIAINYIAFFFLLMQNIDRLSNYIINK